MASDDRSGEDQAVVWTALEALMARADHRTVATWALECARRVQPVLARVAPDETGATRALGHLDRWLTDGVEMEQERHTAVVLAHQLARSLPDRSAARAAARAAAQAAATTQNKEHAIGVAMYAAMAARDADVPGGKADVGAAAAMRTWQRDRLAELLRRASQDAGEPDGAGEQVDTGSAYD